MRPSLAVEESLSVLGNNIRTARLKRRLPQATLAERAGIGLSTLVKIENGNCGVAIGAVASVLFALILPALILSPKLLKTSGCPSVSAHRKRMRDHG